MKLYFVHYFENSICDILLKDTEIDLRSGHKYGKSLITVKSVIYEFVFEGIFNDFYRKSP